MNTASLATAMPCSSHNPQSLATLPGSAGILPAFGDAVAAKITYNEVFLSKNRSALRLPPISHEQAYDKLACCYVDYLSGCKGKSNVEHPTRLSQDIGLLREEILGAAGD
jgi:hypothetical protein